MEDESGMDEKILALPINKVDPNYSNIDSIDDVAESTLARIKNFFETYKMLEKDKWVKVKNYEDKARAYEILESCIKNYKS